jgi:hypothetical protein
MVHFCFIDFCWSVNPLHFIHPPPSIFSPLEMHSTESDSSFNHMEFFMVARRQFWGGAE